MDVTKRIFKVFVALFVAGCVAFIATQPLSAQVTIPAGSTIDTAIFSIMSNRTYQIINLHRITADWGENSVTWNTFAGSYDHLNIIGSFSADSVGWHSVDMTSLVQAWVAGIYPNYGILLEQGLTQMTTYWSSESSPINGRPKLEIWYTTPAGDARYAIIQRPDDAQDGVADAYIWQKAPNAPQNYASLYTGIYEDFEKYALIRFHFRVVTSGVGTGTPGYWKNHPEAWPVDQILIGGRLYTKEEAITFMNMPDSHDKTITMFSALVSAKLNVLIGNDDSCIADTITNADLWMVDHPVDSEVRAGGSASPWRIGEPLCTMLNSYNNGLLPCAQHRD